MAKLHPALLIPVAALFLSSVICFSQAVTDSGPKIIPLVTVMVMAEDTRGNPVLDLKASDLHIFDNDREARMVSLHINNGREPRRTIVLLDQLNTQLTARGRDGSALVSFLRKQDPENASHLYVYVLNRQGLVLPVRSVSEPGSAQAPAVISQLKRDLGQVHRIPSVLQFNWGRRYDVTAMALENLVPPLFGLPGLNDIVWITGGISIVNYRSEAQKLSATLNQVNAAVYVAADPQQQRFVIEQDGSNIDSFETWKLLEGLTALTGGRIVFDVNSAIRKAQADLHTAYQLIYAPDPESWDNTNHTIRLACTRHGTKLRYKQIYFARKQ